MTSATVHSTTVAGAPTIRSALRGIGYPSSPVPSIVTRESDICEGDGDPIDAGNDSIELQPLHRRRAKGKSSLGDFDQVFQNLSHWSYLLGGLICRIDKLKIIICSYINKCHNVVVRESF